MPNQVNAWSLLATGGEAKTDEALAIIEAIPSCVHVNGWAYIEGQRRGIVAHERRDAAAAYNNSPSSGGYSIPYVNTSHTTNITTNTTMAHHNNTNGSGAHPNGGRSNNNGTSTPTVGRALNGGGGGSVGDDDGSGSNYYGGPEGCSRVAAERERKAREEEDERDSKAAASNTYKRKERSPKPRKQKGDNDDGDKEEGSASDEEASDADSDGDVEGSNTSAVGEGDHTEATNAPTSSSTSAAVFRFTGFSIGTTNAFAAPLLFFAILRRNVRAVRAILRQGGSPSMSIKGGVTPLALAYCMADGEAAAAASANSNTSKHSRTKRGTSVTNNTTTATSSRRQSAQAALLEVTAVDEASSPSAVILSIVQRYVAREQNAMATIVEDEEEERVCLIEEEERIARAAIEAKKAGGMVRIVCEIRDDAGSFALPPSRSWSPDGNTSTVTTDDIPSEEEINHRLLSDADSMVTYTSPLGREVACFLFPRYGSYASLRARVEDLCGCRVGISYDRVAMQKLHEVCAEELGGGQGIGGGDQTSFMLNGTFNTTMNATANGTDASMTMRSTARSRSRGGNNSSFGNNTSMMGTSIAAVNLTKGTAARKALTRPQWKAQVMELSNGNFKSFIAQADIILALHNKMTAMMVAAEEEDDAATDEAAKAARRADAEDAAKYYLPPIHCIVRPVPYAAAGNEADAAHYALVRNKTRIAKDLKAYDELPPTERSLARVQALKKQVDDEEREFLTQQNYVQFQSKKISAEEMEAATNRLYEYPMQKLREKNEQFSADVEAQMLKATRTRRPGELSAEQQESVDRLHGAAAEREERIAEMDEEHWATIPQPPVPELEEEEVATIRERLTTDTRDETRAKLAEKYYGEQEAKWHRKLTKEQLQQSVESCYVKPREKKAKEMAKLEAQYGDWMQRKRQFKATPIKKYGK